MTDGERMVWLDCLRLLAGLSMLGLHSTADPAGLPWVQYTVDERVAPLLLRTVLYTARTELFLMISVFLLLLATQRRPRSYGQVVREQSRRLLIPFVFWTVFFAGYGLIKAQSFGYFDQAMARLHNPMEWFGFLILGDVKYHMHFLPTLFALILFFPLFRLAREYPILGLMVVVCLVMKHELDAFIFKNFWGNDALSYIVRMVKVLTYVGYGMAAGAALGVWEKTTAEQRRKWLMPILYLAGMLFSFKLIAMWKTIENSAWVYNYLPSYWADFLFPVLLFGGCMALSNMNWPTAIARAAPYSFGIYLCHPIFLDLCEIGLRGTERGPMTQVAIKIVLTLCATVLFVVLLSKSRHLAWTIGLGPLPNLRFPFRLKQEQREC